MKKLTIILLALVALGCSDDDSKPECVILQQQAVEAYSHMKSVQGTDEYPAAAERAKDLKRRAANCW